VQALAKALVTGSISALTGAGVCPWLSLGCNVFQPSTDLARTRGRFVSGGYRAPKTCPRCRALSNQRRSAAPPDRGRAPTAAGPLAATPPRRMTGSAIVWHTPRTSNPMPSAVPFGPRRCAEPRCPSDRRRVISRNPRPRCGGALHRPLGVPGDAGSTNTIEGGFAVEGGGTPQLVERAGPGCAKRPFDSESTGTTASWSPAIPAWEEVVYE
jgi:hypothetical protein